MAEVDSIGSSTSVSATSQVQTQAPSSDPKVNEAVSATLEHAGAHHLSDPTYSIEQTLADPSLTQAQKDEYVARVVELAGNGGSVCVPEGVIDADISQKLTNSLETIGVAYNSTPELRQQVTDSIARNVESCRLDAGDLHAMVDPARNPVSDGARQLLTGIDDGAVLNRLADTLFTEAQAQGYDFNAMDNGINTLTAAADIAGMAADHGWTASANAIAVHVANAPEVADGMSLAQGMMAASIGGFQYGSPPEGRTGFDALASVVDGARSNDPAVGAATDELFQDLVRSGSDDVIGGIDQAGERGAGLNDLGGYFDRNASRLVESDWRMANTDSPEHGLVRDFMRNVMLDEQYDGRDATATALSNEMGRLAGIVGDDTRGLSDRTNAANSFGTLMGSVQEATRSYVADARGDADDKIELVRGFSDLVTDKLLDRGGPLASELGGAFVDAAWDKLAQSAEDGAQAYADERTGALTETAQSFREAMASLDPAILNGFDLRTELYYDPQPE